jgi:hypothetical protein
MIPAPRRNNDVFASSGSGSWAALRQIKSIASRVIAV